MKKNLSKERKDPENYYLTKKTFDEKKWEKGVRYGLLIFLAMIIYASFQVFKTKDFETLYGSGLLLIMFGIPYIKLYERDSLRHNSNRVGGTLYYSKNKEYTFDELRKKMPGVRHPKFIEKALNKGYMQNMEIDYGAGVLRLIPPNEGIGNIEDAVSVQCPGCGAEQVIDKDRLTRCEYCNTPLICKNKDESEAAYRQRVEKEREALDKSEREQWAEEINEEIENLSSELGID